jgi:hypothetical protein
MRRALLPLVAAAAIAAPLLAAAPADASITCHPQYGIPGRQPFCTVFCAATLDLGNPCWIQD